MEDKLFFWKMEDDLNSFENGRQTQFLENERRPQFLKMEDDLIYLMCLSTDFFFN
jgi:hypothetical protein